VGRDEYHQEFLDKFLDMWPDLTPLSPVSFGMQSFLWSRPKFFLLPRTTTIEDYGITVEDTPLSFEEVFVAGMTEGRMAVAFKKKSTAVLRFITRLTRFEDFKPSKKQSALSFVNQARLLSDWLPNSTWETFKKEDQVWFKVAGSLTSEDNNLKTTLEKGLSTSAKVKTWINLSTSHPTGNAVLQFLQAPILCDTAHKLEGVAQSFTSPPTQAQRESDLQGRQRALSLLTGVSSLDFIKKSLQGLLPQVTDQEEVRSTLELISQFTESAAASLLPLLHWHLAQASSTRQELRMTATKSIQDPDIKETLSSSELCEPKLFSHSGVEKVRAALLLPAPRTVKVVGAGYRKHQSFQVRTSSIQESSSFRGSLAPRFGRGNRTPVQRANFVPVSMPAYGRRDQSSSSAPSSHYNNRGENSRGGSRFRSTFRAGSRPRGRGRYRGVKGL
jgi:hypothetical protein